MTLLATISLGAALVAILTAPVEARIPRAILIVLVVVAAALVGIWMEG